MYRRNPVRFVSFLKPFTRDGVRRVVATALLLSITSALAPFTPLGHVHAEEDEYEVSDVPATEADAAPGVDGAAAVQGGCAPYISGGPNNPDRGVRVSGFCVDVPLDPWGFVTCEVCVCF
ncbi:hypothetical protein [Candidatus Palauibacter sp.]|uniref:hypothetical protein n=1 Tax=Candidatus Palauibacter sp. TaxID=3101350 RepID=UPI003AF2B72F